MIIEIICITLVVLTICVINYIAFDTARKYGRSLYDILENVSKYMMLSFALAVIFHFAYPPIATFFIVMASLTLVALFFFAPFLLFDALLVKDRVEQVVSYAERDAEYAQYLAHKKRHYYETQQEAQRAQYEKYVEYMREK